MDDFWLVLAIQGAKMRQKSAPARGSTEKIVKDIGCWRIFSAEEKDPHRAGGPAASGQRLERGRSRTQKTLDRGWGEHSQTR
jgi:hypothetical protein